MFYLLLVVGILVRLFLVPIAGFKADIAFWKGWGLAVADKGVLWLVNETNYNYPPGFAYVLWVINKVYAFFKNPYDINEYWLDNNVFYLFLIKLLTILADLLIVWLIIKMAKVILNGKSNLGKLVALFYFLNPAVLYDGVIWGQVDQFGLALFLLSLYFLMKRRLSLASIIFTVSWLMKFQNIIFIPLFYLFIFRYYTFKELIISLRDSFITFLAVVFPFILAKQAERLIYLLTVNSDWFPWYSLNAFNVWWIASGLKGMQLVDKHLVFGVISAKQFGLFMFVFTYFISTVTIFFSKKEELGKNFILACSLAVFGFFHLLTQSHERYLFPLMGLLPLLTMYDQKSVKKFYIFYILFSLFFFVNMYLSMAWNYPDQAYLPFTKELTISFSLVLSLAQIILFLGFFFYYFVPVIMHYRLVMIPFVSLWLLTIFFKNVPYLLKKPIPLASMKPISYGQEYLVPVANKTVESSRGIKFWNRLSVNYFFYEEGIGSHANSHLTYDLDRKFSRFISQYGLDTEGAEVAKVYFTVEADGKEIYRSKPMGRFDGPVSVNLDVKGVNYLTLKITKAGESNFGAHADWLEPVIVR